jgi:hypothetical protein
MCLVPGFSFGCKICPLHVPPFVPQVRSSYHEISRDDDRVFDARRIENVIELKIMQSETDPGAQQYFEV